MRNKIIYVGTALVVATIISLIYDEFAFTDSLFMVASLRILFNLLGLLSNNGTYDFPRYQFHVMRKKVIQKEAASTFQEYVDSREKRTGLGFKMIINALMILFCIVAYYLSN